MKGKHRGLSLDYMARWYDRIVPSEKSRFRRKQIEMLAPGPGEKVLEVGCGTGVLSLLAKRAVGAQGEVEGIDISTKMIGRAREKARAAELGATFRVASVDELPYADEHFDAVISSLMFHHLPVEVKKSGLREIHRVLKPGGRFLLCDFCTPRLLAAPLMVPLLLWMSATRHQLFGGLPKLIGKSPFASSRLVRKGWFVDSHLMIKQPA